jgi:hypothetical protein
LVCEYVGYTYWGIFIQTYCLNIGNPLTFVMFLDEIYQGGACIPRVALLKNMTRNMGTADGIIRLIITAIIAVLFGMKILTGTLAIVLLILGGIFLVTSTIRYCPLYSLFGINTAKNKSRK